MKTLKLNFCSLLILAFLFPLGLFAQTKEIQITTSSKDALKLFLDGRDKLLNLEYIAAATSFDNAIQKDPSFALAYLFRSQSGGGSVITRKNLDKAISLTGNVSDGEKTMIQYIKSSNDGNGEKQKEYLDQMLKSFPSDKVVRAFAGNYYYGMGDFKTALDQFTATAAIDKNLGFAYNMIGYCQSALENYPEAEKAFQTYIKLCPLNGNPYDSYGELLLKLGKYDESIAQYKKAYETDNLNFVGSLAGIGNNYIFKGDYENARKYYQEYFDKATIITYKLGAIFLKAISYLYEGKPENTIKTLDEYIAMAEKGNLKTTVINGTGYQGIVMTETGNPAEGLKYFDKVKDLVNNSSLPDAVKENYKTGMLMQHFYGLTACGRYDEALAESEKCKTNVESRKNMGELYQLNSLLGIYEMKKGNNSKAIDYFGKALKSDPYTWYYNALALKNNGDKQGAFKLFEKVTKVNSNSMNLALVRNRALDELKK